MLPETNSNKVYHAVQSIVLKARLYGEAADLCSGISNDDSKIDNGTNLTINSVYQRGFLSVISEAYEGFHNLLYTKRNENESLKNFETCFSAAVTKFNSLSDTTKLPQCVTALMLFSNAEVEHLQRLSCSNAAVPNGTLFDD